MAVFSAIAGVVASVSTFVGSLGVVGSAILKTVVGIGLNKLAVKLSGKNASGPSFSVKGQLQRGADLPQSFILGKAATAGSLTYANTWGHAGKTPNAFLTMVITLSDLPLQSLDAVWVNGVRGTIAPIPHEIYGHPIPEFHRDGSDYVWVKPFMGDQVLASPYLVGDVSNDDRPWDDTAIGERTAYVVITFKVNQELFSGFPQVLFEVTGMPLYDPSRDSSVGGDGAHRWDDPATWGGDGDHLPAVQVYNLMRGINVNGQWLYGMQATSAAQLPAAHWIEQINKCRAGIVAHDGTEATYRAGGEIAVGASIVEAIEALLDACQGRLSEAGGVYKLFVGAPGDPIATFSDADILSTEEQSFTPFFGLADTVNGISGKFPDPAQSWQVETAPPLLRDDLETEDGERRLMADVQFDLVPYAEQVQRLMRAALNEARRARRHTFTLPPKFWALEPGDVVAWTSERNGYDGKLFRVDGVLDQPDADVVVDLTEVDPSDYDFNTVVDFTPVSPTVLGSTGVAAQAITGWSVEATTVRDGEGNDRMPAILVRWNGDVEDVAAVRVQVRHAGGGDLVFDGRVEDVATGQGVVSQAILSLTDYEVRGKFVPGTPRPVDWSGWLTVTTLDVPIGVLGLADEVWESIDDAAETQAQSVIDDFRSTEFTPVAAQLTLDREVDRADINDILNRNHRLEEALDEFAYEAMEGMVDAFNARDEDRQALASAKQVLEAGITEANEAVATARTELGAEIAGNTADLIQEAQVRAAADEVQASDITALDVRMGDAETGLVGETQARAELTGRVTATETGLVAQGDDIVALGSRLDDAETGQAGQVQALNQLTTRVADNEGTLTTHGQSLTQIEAELTSAGDDRAAQADALQTLTTDVAQIGDSLTPMSAYDLFLEARITATEEDLLDGVIQDAAQAELGRQNTREDVAVARQQFQAGIDEQGVALAEARTDLGARIGDAEASIIEERQARSDGEEALATSLTETQASVANAEALITNEQTARAQADAAQASQINQTIARVTDAEGDIAAQAGQISSVQADVSTVNGQLTATVSSVNTISAQVRNQQTLISEQQTAIAGLGGSVQYNINVNGHVAGWALSNEVAQGGNPWSAFTFVADKFQISAPSGEVTPFIAYTSATNVNGVYVPAGTYMSDTFIRNGSINNAKIGTAQITRAKIGGNEVTFSQGQTAYSHISGNDTWREVQWFYYNLPEYAPVILLFQAKQHYSAGGPLAHDFRILVDGTERQAHGGTAIADYPILMWHGYLPGGQRRVSVEWKAPSTVQVRQRTLAVLGMMR